MNIPVTKQEAVLWTEYFCTIDPIAHEFNAKHWPVMTLSKVDLDLERARYIGAFCYVYDRLRRSISTNNADQYY
jgi:hypothetical protein